MQNIPFGTYRKIHAILFFLGGGGGGGGGEGAAQGLHIYIEVFSASNIC